MAEIPANRMAAKRFMRMVFSPVRTRAMAAGRDMAADREIVPKERRVTVSRGQALAALRTSSWGASTEVGPARLRQSKSVEVGNSRFRCARLEGWQQTRPSKRPFFETRRQDAALLMMRSELFLTLSAQFGVASAAVDS